MERESPIAASRCPSASARRRVLLSVLLCFLIKSEPSAAQEQADGSCISEAWTRQAKEFVVEVTKAPIPTLCIGWAGQDRLNALVAGPVYGSAHPDAAALFLPAGGEILLADDLDPGDPTDRSNLVHELIHAQQFARGAADEPTCIGLLEGEAYSIQARYLRRHGLGQEAFLFQMIGMLQSACAIDY